jgi:hypothetical protein
MREVVDLGEVLLVHEADTEPDLWLGPPGTTESPRLVEAIARGEVTAGGLAEAGWRWIGKISTERRPSSVSRSGSRRTPMDRDRARYRTDRSKRGSRR